MVDISVVIPTYEAGEPLIDAIESVIKQEGVVTQVVVIEDGSSTPSSNIIERCFSDHLEHDNGSRTSSIKYITQNNAGAYLTRIRALEHCEGNFIKFLDQDDVLLPGALITELQAFNTKVDVVLSNWFIADVQLRTAGRKELKTAPLLENPIDDFLRYGGVFTSAALYRACLIKRVLTPVSSFTPVKADDWLIFAQICLGGARYKTIDSTAYIWHQSDDQLSKLSRYKLVIEHYNILNWIENELQQTERLTQTRKKLLANYYAKQLIEAYESERRYFIKLIEKVERLNPGYQMQHGNRIYRQCCDLLGLKSGVAIYVSIKKAVRFKFVQALFQRR